GGLRQSLRLRLLWPLYLCGLALGLLQTWPLLIAAANGALFNPFLGQLAHGGGDALADLAIADTRAFGLSARLWGLAALAFAGLFVLAYNFFSGGILSLWAGTRPFWPGCRHTFWTFTGLGVLLVLLAALVLVGAALLGGLLGTGGMLIVAAVLLQLINLFGEYARAIAVAQGRHNPFVLLGRAIGFCARHPGALGLGLLGLLLHVALLLLVGAALGAIGGTVAAIVPQQLAVLAWLWVKLLRLAWALSYVRLRSGPIDARAGEAALNLAAG
ncbi:MAG: hypothetical protein ACJ8CR_01745, partial [Roseiflexaceae bacterium]